MGKKAKKAAKEIQRLQALYSTDAKDQQDRSKKREEIKQDSPKVVAPVISDNISSTPQPAKTMELTQHSIVKRDLVFIAFLIVGMVVVLFILNFLVNATNLSDWVVKLAGNLS